MTSTTKNLLLLVAAVLALAAGYWAAQALRPEPEPAVTATKYGGGDMVDFRLPDLEGKPRAIGDWRGKVIVLNFWATWCPPCREEIPLFIELQKQRAAEGLQVVSVAIDDIGAVVRYRDSAGINYPILMGEDDGLDLIARYGNRLGSLPYTVIMDRQGAITARKLGAFTRKELQSLVDPLLKPPQNAKFPNS